MMETDMEETKTIETVESVMAPYEYGAVSSRFRLMAPTKLVAYATMVVHYQENPGLVAIYEPESSKEDSWLNFRGNTEALLDKLYGGDGTFTKFLESHVEEIKACLQTIKQLV